MNNRLNSKYSFKTKLGIVVALQVVLVVVLYLFLPRIYATFNSLLLSESNLSDKCWLHKNIVSNGREYELDISATSVVVENGKIGFFRTYANRKVEVTNLVLKIDWSMLDNVESANIELANSLGSVVSNISDSHASTSNFGGNWGIDTDLSNLLSFSVIGFDCELFNSGNSVIQVKSRRACVIDKNITILLEGNVEIKCSSNRIFRANKVRWMVDEGVLVGVGPCMLVEGQKRINGSNLTVNYDSGLEIL